MRGFKDAISGQSSAPAIVDASAPEEATAEQPARERSVA